MSAQCVPLGDESTMLAGTGVRSPSVPASSAARGCISCHTRSPLVARIQKIVNRQSGQCQ